MAVPFFGIVSLLLYLSSRNLSIISAAIQSISSESLDPVEARKKIADSV